jgi:2-oxo-4-hydroxy-4-carboxy-5-ureidoimidazoline decarboxylase
LLRYISETCSDNAVDMPTTNSSGLDAFNALADQSAASALLECCHSDSWAGALAAARPFESVDALLECADSVLRDLPESEIDKALAGHPRIGERTESASSSRDQAAVATAGDDVLGKRLGNDPETERRVLRIELAAINRIRLTRLIDSLSGDDA